MHDSQYCGPTNAWANAADNSQQFVVSSEPTLTVNSVGADYATFVVRVSIPTGGPQVEAKRDHYVNFTASIEQLEAMLVHVRKERARIKRLIAKAYDDEVKSAEANLQRAKNARKAEANKA